MLRKCLPFNIHANICLIILMVFGMSRMMGQNSGALSAESLTCENLIQPVGIDTREPRLSWVLKTAKRGATQTAFRILASTSLEALNANSGDLWDSGKVSSDQNLYVNYNGQKLHSNELVFWKVKVWDNYGEESAWSDPANFSIGLIEKSDWTGNWIGLDKELGQDKLDTTFTRLSARYLRKEIEIPKEIKRATAHVSGLGLFEFYLNGNKIGKAVLSPALAEYPERAYYLSFDVTDELEMGGNAIGVILGNGRYVGVRGKEIVIYYDASKLTHKGFPKMISQLEVEYADGTRQTFTSNTSWKVTAKGPILANNEFDGEEYDANKEMSGWSKPGFDDSKWLQAEKVEPGANELQAQMVPPIKVTQDIKPETIRNIARDTFIMDMGQNMVGWLKMMVKGQKNDTVSLRFSERLNPDGSLYLDPIRTAKVNDKYILKGGEEEEWEPRFTYHGFRYVEISGFPGEPEIQNFTGRVVHDDLDSTGRFRTSNDLINQIYENARWGIRGNYRSIPTDCPQRDERQGWLGDRATGSRGESYLFDNANFYLKWLQDIEDSQTPEGSLPDVAPTYWNIYTDNMTWPAAYIIIADMLHDQFGEDKAIRKHYSSMKKWMEYMRNNYMYDYILDRDNYGDWGVPPEDPELIHTEDTKRKASGAVLGTSYYYNLLGIMQDFATLLGKENDANEFLALKKKLQQSFHENFFDPDKRSYKNNTATTNVLALHFGLVPENYKTDVFNNLLKITMEDFNGHISVGLIGVQAIMRIFTENGRPDIAYKLATNTSYPSWGYMVEQGATTIWELWNSDTADPFMNSWNHVMLLGDLLIWYYEDLAGIKPDTETPGFKKIIMKPNLIGDLEFVTAAHDSPYGRISSEWKMSKGKFQWKIEIPANTSARVYIPAESKDQVKEGDAFAASAKGVNFLREDGDRQVFEIGSGEYIFKVSD